MERLGFWSNSAAPPTYDRIKLSNHALQRSRAIAVDQLAGSLWIRLLDAEVRRARIWPVTFLRS